MKPMPHNPIPALTYASKHPAIVDDRRFFAENPHRRFRARAFQPIEIGWPADFMLFGPNEFGEISEINLVILERIKGGRIRRHFAAYNDPLLNTDSQIMAFLRSRGIAPFTYHWKAPRP